MKEDKIKGGKADKMSINSIAKKHEVSKSSIEKQIDMGEKIEMEHVDDEVLAKEIAMDHLEEIPDYYTRLKKMEKEAKKELSLEVKRFMALAGIKEHDKLFLKNESFKEKIEDEKKEKDEFIIYEFERTYIPPGKDDYVYKIKKRD